MLNFAGPNQGWPRPAIPGQQPTVPRGYIDFHHQQWGRPVFPGTPPMGPMGGMPPMPQLNMDLMTKVLETVLQQENQLMAVLDKMIQEHQKQQANPPAEGGTAVSQANDPSKYTAKYEGASPQPPYKEDRGAELLGSKQHPHGDIRNGQLLRALDRKMNHNQGMSALPKTQLEALIKQKADQHGIPYALLRGLIQQESSCNPNAENHTNKSGVVDYGLCQVQEKTARSLGVYGNLKDPATNLEAACRLIDQLRGKFGSNNWRAVLKHYNGGPGHLSARGEAQTDRYADLVEEKMQRLHLGSL